MPQYWQLLGDAMTHEQRQALEMADSSRGVTEAVLATHGLAR